VSSILDALEKVEATRGPLAPGGIGGAPAPRRPWTIVALVVVAVVAGAGGAALLLARKPATPEPAPAPAAEPVAVTQAPAKRAGSAKHAAVVPKPTAPPALAPARAPVAPPPAPPTVAPSATAPMAVGSAPRVAAPVPAPEPGMRERPWGTEPEAPKPPASLVLGTGSRAVPPPVPYPPTPQPEVQEPPQRIASKTPTGAPRLRVSFLVYSSIAERRSVALTIDSGSLTTLREGEESNGVEVVRIRPNGVDVRWQGETFALEVRS
jgi:hypothetical protein